MVNYRNSKIYIIRNNIDGELYVGSSTQPLSKRMGEHRSMAKSGNYDSRQLYKHMRHLGCENFYIELHEKFPCNSREELCKREGEVIRLIGTLNNRMAGRTPCESQANYYKRNIETVKESQKRWKESNPDRYREYQKQYQTGYSDRRNEKTTCENCRSVVSKYTIKRHQQSKKCQSHVQSKNINISKYEDRRG
jgi:group I intron endonuclease